MSTLAPLGCGGSQPFLGLDALVECWSDCVECSSAGVCVTFSSWLERTTTEVNTTFLTSYQRCILSAWHIIVDVNFDCLNEGVFVRILHCKVTFFPLSILCCLEGSRYMQPTLHEWGVMLQPLEDSVIYLCYLEFFYKGDLALVSHLLVSHLVISLWTHGYLFSALVIIQCYFILCSNCSSFGH